MSFPENGPVRASKIWDALGLGPTPEAPLFTKFRLSHPDARAASDNVEASKLPIKFSEFIGASVSGQEITFEWICGYESLLSGGGQVYRVGYDSDDGWDIGSHPDQNGPPSPPNQWDILSDVELRSKNNNTKRFRLFTCVPERFVVNTGSGNGGGVDGGYGGIMDSYQFTRLSIEPADQSSSAGDEWKWNYCQVTLKDEFNNELATSTFVHVNNTVGDSPNGGNSNLPIETQKGSWINGSGNNNTRFFNFTLQGSSATSYNSASETWFKEFQAKRNSIVRLTFRFYD